VSWDYRIAGEVREQFRELDVELQELILDLLEEAVDRLTNGLEPDFMTPRVVTYGRFTNLIAVDVRLHRTDRILILDGIYEEALPFEDW
jgi:hypothetical protein